MAGAAARQRQAYEAMLNDDAEPFITGVPVLFSPAGAAQDEANPKGGYGRFAQILLPMEYGSWAQEAQAHVRSAYLGDWTSLSKVLLRGRAGPGVPRHGRAERPVPVRDRPGQAPRAA